MQVQRLTAATLLLGIVHAGGFNSAAAAARGQCRGPLAAFACSFRTLRSRFGRAPHMSVVSPYADKPYPVGTPGTPWGAQERAAWLARQVNQRSYADEVIKKVDALRSKGSFTVEQYGSLSVDPERYPLYVFKTLNWDASKPVCLVTGGVHGYETSGVQGALLFLDTDAEKYKNQVNLVVAPCVSPWGYEHIQRWNNNADDPNRNFVEGSPCDECNALRGMLGKLKAQGTSFALHIDLHETTNSDEEEFMPAKAARDGVQYEQGYIPDGFYLVGDSENPQPEWHAAMIEAVKKVTHIAPPDVKGEIIGEKPTQEGGCCTRLLHSTALCTCVVPRDRERERARSERARAREWEGEIERESARACACVCTSLSLARSLARSLSLSERERACVCADKENRKITGIYRQAVSSTRSRS